MEYISYQEKVIIGGREFTGEVEYMIDDSRILMTIVHHDGGEAYNCSLLDAVLYGMVSDMEVHESALQLYSSELEELDNKQKRLWDYTYTPMHNGWYRNENYDLHPRYVMDESLSLPVRTKILSGIIEKFKSGGLKTLSGDDMLLNNEEVRVYQLASLIERFKEATGIDMRF